MSLNKDEFYLLSKREEMDADIFYCNILFFLRRLVIFKSEKSVKFWLEKKLLNIRVTIMECGQQNISSLVDFPNIKYYLKDNSIVSC